VPGDDGPPLGCGLALGCNFGGYWVLFLDPDGTVKGETLNGAGFPLFGEGGSALAGLGDLDLDTVPDLAVGVPGLNGNAGGVFVVLQLPNGSARTTVVITEGSAGFGGDLAGGGRFGAALAPLGDLDGNGTTDLAIGEPESGTGRVWIVFLKADGTVLREQELGPGVGGFGAGLEDLDRFGGALTLLDDLDGDGIGELCVGAHTDDDGGLNRGAVWILGLNSDGTVRSQSKVSASAGGFAGTLDDSDWFGFSGAVLGDLDGDGAPELSVGAPRDDDGGDDRGAVWILSLEQGGCGRPEAVVRNGTGMNPGTLSTTNLPTLGGVLELRLDCTAHRRGAAAIFGRGAASGFITGHGELLINLSRPGVLPFHLVDQFRSSVVTFRLAIPDDLALCGQVVYVQGVCNGAPRSQLSNAIDLLLGQ